MRPTPAAAFAGVVSAAGRTPCVLDVRLLLSSLGVLTAVRLATCLEVFLPGEFRELLREDKRTPGTAERLVPRPMGASARERLDLRGETAIAELELDAWHRYATEPDLARQPLYYLGDREDEARLPATADTLLRRRFEGLAQGLDRRLEDSHYDLPRGWRYKNMLRDSVALCAALSAYGGILLTRVEAAAGAEGQPALCDYLFAAGLRPLRVEDTGGLVSAPLRQALARTGLAALWSGVSLVAVHVAVPGYPVLGAPDPEIAPELAYRQWPAARVCWFPLGA